MTLQDSSTNDDDRDSDSGGELHVMDRATGKSLIFYVHVKNSREMRSPKKGSLERKVRQIQKCPEKNSWKKDLKKMVPKKKVPEKHFFSCIVKVSIVREKTDILACKSCKSQGTLGRHSVVEKARPLLFFQGLFSGTFFLGDHFPGFDFRIFNFHFLKLYT